MVIIRQSEFESKPGWRATIKRRDLIGFIIEGEGKLKGRFYEYPEDWFSRDGVGPALEIEVDVTRLHVQLEAGQIKLLKGELP